MWQATCSGLNAAQDNFGNALKDFNLDWKKELYADLSFKGEMGCV